jgi:hypothetical protein
MCIENNANTIECGILCEKSQCIICTQMSQNKHQQFLCHYLILVYIQAGNRKERKKERASVSKSDNSRLEFLDLVR